VRAQVRAAGQVSGRCIHSADTAGSRRTECSQPLLMKRARSNSDLVAHPAAHHGAYSVCPAAVVVIGTNGIAAYIRWSNQL
jgi:hypothetical protein